MKNQQPSALSPAPRLDNALVSPDIHQKRLNGQNHAKGISNSSFDNRSPSSNNSHESHLSNDYMEGEADVFPCEGSAGRLPEEVYDRTMSRWRAAIRRKVKECVERESPVIAAMQECIAHTHLRR
ncbi:hypothetical protein AcW1_007323 [Taiwanofungus camphoratus]|nr:hypothetical protein AcW2_007606 [Antrodia cinnamomea]KAI0920019.1 hypothetical protein AcV7_006031 [Antrodia cinnamomea]KAI0927428.1 hypothetical protein AcV5_007971 [Antrodia cinnamomea]KAI0952990.1 hypothetical protein AcW1_007323 [Antrodia cinnamomea]